MVCFGRFVYSDGEVVLSFLFGKSKISPNNGELSIPRLELVAAALATRVACLVLQENNIKFDRVLYWTDSSAVLHLIRNNTRRLGVFVEARLAEIRGSSAVENWHYVPTALNCADVGTRVISPKNKKRFLPWFEGPIFLLATNFEFPTPPNVVNEVSETISALATISDIKNECKSCCLSPFEKFVAFINYYSEYDHLLRSLCYIFRVVKACWLKSKKEKRRSLSLMISPLTVKERGEAETFVIRLMQRECFGKLYEHICALNGEICFKVGKSLKAAFRPLKQLNVFCDREGLLRSHSRIVNADMKYDARFPIILPKKHNFVEMLVRKTHCELGHFGWSFVLARLQKRFWILRGQTCVRSYIKNCVFCQFRRAKSSSQMMAALPKERLLSGERAFFATGCDFFGPINVTEFRKKIKRWGCIFVCFSTRAVHIEVCYRMTCDSFLEAFFRFFNTRGHSVRYMWCDNGSKF